MPVTSNERCCAMEILRSAKKNNAEAVSKKETAVLGAMLLGIPLNLFNSIFLLYNMRSIPASKKFKKARSLSTDNKKTIIIRAIAVLRRIRFPGL